MITFSLLVIWTGYFILLYLVIFWLLVFLENDIEDKQKEIKEFPLVTVAIPAYNEQDSIEETIQSVLSLDYPKEKLELIIVDDGSKDNTNNIVQSIIKNNIIYNIKLMQQENSGKGSALNKALYKAKGEIFTPLDADSTIRSDALRKILPYFKDNNVAAVLPLMKIKNPTNLLQKIQWCEYLINLFYKKLMSILDCVHVAPGPFSTYRKSALLKVNGFDEKNLTEDLEVSLKLQKNHYKLLQIFSTEVYTYAPKTFKEFYKQRNRWYKGTLLNAFNYKQMAFNKKYGDFGFIQMPRIMLESILIVAIFLIVGYNTVLSPLIKKFYNLSLTDFNIAVPINNFLDNFTILDVNFTNIFYTISVLVASLTLLYVAHKHTREPLKKYGLFVIPAYLLLYSLLASTVLIGVFIDLARGKKQRW